MTSPKSYNGYIATIGIECHVQLKTNTKLFAAVGNDARDAEPNSLISHICLGMPGALPVLNKRVIDYAVRAAFALNTRPQTYSYFERKHYFYPDLPKGYQISQLSHPIIVGGTVPIFIDDDRLEVRINRVQIEEDAGKSSHPDGADYSLVDLNRAGTPLLEIVSEADMHTPAQARAYARELWLLMRYINVSDADMYHGNMRFDVNVSVSKDPKKWGLRTETKNLNSFKSVEKAIEYEINRQIKVIEKGQVIVQETRGWDDTKQVTFSQRSKEDAHDYRYFPDPDIPPVILSEDYIDCIKKDMPVLPEQWRERLAPLGLNKSQIDILLEAEVEYEDISYLSVIEQNSSNEELAKFLANWNVNVMIPLVKEGSFKLKDGQYMMLEMAIYGLIKDKKISSTRAKDLFIDIIAKNKVPDDIKLYAQDNGYTQESNEGEIKKIVSKVLGDNEKAAQDVKNGEMKAIGFLVGQVMKESKGKANPTLAQELIKKQLRI